MDRRPEAAEAKPNEKMQDFKSSELKQSLLVMRNLVQFLQKIDPEFPPHYAVCLFEIALNEGLSLTQLAEKVDLSLSTVSRIVGALSDFRPNGLPYGLIEIRVSVAERRRKELILTSKGKSFILKLAKTLHSS
jgi:DNA-binding MarR family transcriptional regulator